MPEERTLEGRKDQGREENERKALCIKDKKWFRCVELYVG
jgi:hypothetical protein